MKKNVTEQSKQQLNNQEATKFYVERKCEGKSDLTSFLVLDGLQRFVFVYT